MKRIIWIAILALVISSGTAMGQDGSGGTGGYLAERPEFLLANTVNLVAAGLFLTRVHFPSAATALGVATMLTGVPAAALVGYNVLRGAPFVQSLPAIAWIGFVLTDLALDYVWNVEFRNPTRWGILAPFLVLYYGSTVSLWASTWPNGLGPYLATTATFVLQAGLSIYSRLHEVRDE
jgi:hypothetical protein